MSCLSLHEYLQTFGSSTCSSAELRLFHHSHSLWFFTLNFQNAPLCLSGVNNLFFNGRIRISWFGTCTDLTPSRRAASSGQPSPQIGWGPDPSHYWPSGPSWCSWQCGYLRWLLPGSAQHHPSQPPSRRLWLPPLTGTPYPQCLTPPEVKNKKISSDGVFLCSSYFRVKKMLVTTRLINKTMFGEVNNLSYKFYCNVQRKCKDYNKKKQIKSCIPPPPLFRTLQKHVLGLTLSAGWWRIGSFSSILSSPFKAYSFTVATEKIKSETHLK